MEEGQDQDVTAVELEGVFWTGSREAGNADKVRTNLLFTTLAEALWPLRASPADSPRVLAACLWLFVRVSERDRTTVIDCCRRPTARKCSTVSTTHIEIK
jgi:hypothetical protein